MSVVIRESHANNVQPLWVPAGSSGGAILPAGMVMEYAGSSAPNGWLFCTGVPVSRAQYAELFGVIGTTYGPGDGATTFNLPNTQGKTVRGVSVAPFTLGASGGADSVTLITDNIPAHSHPITDPGHTHALTYAGLATTNSTAGSLAGPAPGQAYSNVDGAPVEAINSASTGITGTGTQTTAGTAVTVQNPFVVFNYIIKYTSQNL